MHRYTENTVGNNTYTPLEQLSHSCLLLLHPSPTQKMRSIAFQDICDLAYGHLIFKCTFLKLISYVILGYIKYIASITMCNGCGT